MGVSTPVRAHASRRDVGDGRGGAEHQVGSVGALHLLAVDRAAQIESNACLVRHHQLRAERGRRLEGLALQPLHCAVLPVPRGDVVEYRVAGDRGLGGGFVGVPDGAPDDDRQLGLPVDRRGRRRQHDVVVGTDQRLRVLGKQRRELRQLPARMWWA